jgi:hypothetical protein
MIKAIAETPAYAEKLQEALKEGSATNAEPFMQILREEAESLVREALGTAVPEGAEERERRKERVARHRALLVEAQENGGEDTPRYRQCLRDAHAECADRGAWAQAAAREFDPSFTLEPCGWWTEYGHWSYAFVVSADILGQRVATSDQTYNWERALNAAADFKLPFDAHLSFEVDTDPNGPQVEVMVAKEGCDE